MSCKVVVPWGKRHVEVADLTEDAAAQNKEFQIWVRDNHARFLHILFHEEGEFEDQMDALSLIGEKPAEFYNAMSAALGGEPAGCPGALPWPEDNAQSRAMWRHVGQSLLEDRALIDANPRSPKADSTTGSEMPPGTETPPSQQCAVCASAICTGTMMRSTESGAADQQASMHLNVMLLDFRMSTVLHCPASMGPGEM